MKDKKAQKMIDAIIDEVNKNGISVEENISQLKSLRKYAVEDKEPVIAKALRLAYEHLEENESFIIPIPTDEPLEGEEDDVQMITGDESFVYFMNLIKNSSNKINIQELREYNRLLEL